MKQDKDYPGVDGQEFKLIIGKEDFNVPKPVWEPYENVLLREKLMSEQLVKMAEHWTKEFPWLKDRYNESKQAIQNNQQGELPEIHGE